MGIFKERPGLFIVALLFLTPTAVLAADWDAREIRILNSLALSALQPVPDSPSNRYADNMAAADLGKQLFFDTGLSSNGQISCATCHQPDQHFTDGMPRSKGTGNVMRNSPSIIGAAYNRWFYWDGRRDSLWAQALIPFEAQDEMGSSRVAVLRTIAEDENYHAAYLRIFGTSINIDFQDIAAHAGPFADDEGRTAWASISYETQETINFAYANIGKAIAAYERTLQPAETQFDRFVGGLQASAEKYPLSEMEAAGARLFLDAERTQCLQCHNGPLLTNGEFHNIGSGNFSGDDLDFGRSIGLRAVLMDEFNCLGPYSDAQQQQCRELLYLNMDSHLPLRGAFKVPTLRNLAKTAPYFHDGRFATLRDVLRFYNEPPSTDAVGPHELRPMGLSEREIAQLEAFLLVFTD